ncbi:MAG: hypothetical protein HYV63_06475 [Candidatus Schekmanbacteria bacterium]|nr:hypothetical protein [Candidatus Schekmanbacteria bacterium]
MIATEVPRSWEDWRVFSMRLEHEAAALHRRLGLVAYLWRSAERAAGRGDEGRASMLDAQARLLLEEVGEELRH